MVGIPRNIAARAAINGHTRIDFIKISVAALLEPECFLGGHPWAFVLGNFFAFFDWPDGKKTEPGNRAADAKRSARHFRMNDDERRDADDR